MRAACKLRVASLPCSWVMPRKCCVPGCRSNYASKIGSGYVSVFSFPQADEQKRAWIDSIPRADWSPSAHSFVCLKHFSEADVSRIEIYVDKSGVVREYPRNRPILRPGAVPSIFPPPPLSCRKPKTSQRREPKKRKLRVGALGGDSVLAEIISQDVQSQASTSDKLLTIKTEVSSPHSEECSSQQMQDASNDSSRYQGFFEAVDTTMEEPVASPGSSAVNQIPPSHSGERSNEVLERTVQRLLEAQSAAVSSVLAAQNEFLLKVLEADRERHARLEAKLDLILERLERAPSGGQEQQLAARLGRLLDRLEWALPLAAYPPPGIFHPPPHDAQLQLGALLQNLNKYVRAQQSPGQGDA